MSRLIVSSLKNSFSILKPSFRLLHFQHMLILKSSLPSVTSFLRNNYATVAPKIKSNSSNVEDLIIKLDRQVRRLGRSSLKDIQGIIEEVKRSGSVTSTQALLLVRSCGGLLVDETPQKRSLLTEEIWNTLQELDVRLDVSHYNALLRVYLENDNPFKPSDILSELSRKSIEPNRVTCQRLVARYCQAGDIGGAMRILEFMREKSMPVNETIFNSLISGHSVAKNVKSAESILKVMTDSGIEPSAESYVALMTGYITNGNLDKFDEWMKYCESDGIEFHESNYFEIIYVLAQNNYEDRIDQVLTKIRKVPSYNVEAMNFVLKLLSANKLDIGFKVLKTMDKIIQPNGTLLPIGNFFVSFLVRNDYPAETILKYCSALMDEGLNPKALSVAMENSLRYAKENMGLELFRFAKGMSIPIRHHYFWPFLASRGIKGDLDGILKLVSIMSQEFGLVVNNETLREFIVPYVAKLNIDISKLVEEIGKHGVNTSNIVGALVSHLVDEKKGKTAIKLVKDYPTTYNFNSFRITLNNYLIDTEDVNSYVTLLKDLYANIYYANSMLEAGEGEEDNRSFDHRSFVGSMLEYVISKFMSHDNTAVVEKLIKSVHDNQIGVSDEKLQLIKGILKNKVSPATIELLDNLSCEEFEQPVRKKIRARSPMDDEALERLAERLSQKGESTVGIKIRLFVNYNRGKELDKLLKVKEELETEGFELTIPMQVFLIENYIHHEKYEEALQVYKKLKETAENFTLNPAKTLNLAQALVKCGEYDEAMEILKYKIDTTEITEKIDDENLNSAATYAWRLLDHLAEKGDEEKIKEFFDVLVSSKFIDVTRVLAPLVKIHLKKGQSDAALHRFAECVEKYKVTPLKTELLEHFIKLGDGDNLQKVVDLDTQVHGETNALCDVMIIFLECGRIKEARKILETPGVRLRRLRLRAICSKYVANNQIEHIQNLLKVTDGIPLIDQECIYNALLNFHYNNNDVDSALALWTEMQDKDVSITDDFLIQLSELLNKNGLSVPFVVPAKSIAAGRESHALIDRHLINNIKRCINNGDLDEAIKLKRSSDWKYVSRGIYSDLLFALLKQSRYEDAKQVFSEHLQKTGYIPDLKTLKELLYNATVVGDVDFLNGLEKHFQPNMKKLLSFSSKRALAYYNANRIDEFVSMLEEKFKNAHGREDLAQFIDNFPRALIFKISEIGELAVKVESMMRKCMELEPKNVVMPNLLWMYELNRKNFDEADKIWSTHLKNERRVIFRSVLIEMKKKQDLEIGEKLLGYFEKKENIEPSVLGIIYTRLIDTCLHMDSVEQAMKFLERALTKIEISNIAPHVLNSLKDACLNRNINFSYELPANNRRRTERIEGDTSDSD